MVLGRERAAWAYALIVIGAYVSIVVGTALGAMPWPALLGLLTLPFAVQAIRRMLRYHGSMPEVVPALAATIQLHLGTGLLLCIGYIIAHLL